MASTNFVDFSTTLTAAYMNEVNALLWTVFNGKSTAGTSGTLLRSNGTNIVNTTATYPFAAGTSGTILRSDGTNIVNSTATYPNTVLANRILYASSDDVVAGLASANSGVLITSPSGVPSISTTLPTSLNIPSASLTSASLGNASTATTQSPNDNSTKLATTAYVDNAASVPVGTIFDYAGSSLPTGWLACDGSAVSRTTYSALFAAISTTWGAGNGTTTFNVPDLRGRTTINEGTGTTVDSATATSSNGWTITSSQKWTNGMPVVLSNLTGFTTSASAGPTYYVYLVSATNLRLCTTLALAQAGTPDVTASGTGTVIFTYTMTVRTLGNVGGEQSHAMSSTELLSHTHASSFTTPGGGGISYNGNGSATPLNPNSNTGGNAAMNIMQPFAVVKKIIKT